jgi:hypothetical protein
MENKYYTPQIEEFHVGFEYEYLTVDGKWVKDIFMSIKPEDTEQMDLSIVESILKNHSTELRVKYIDKEDIVSLGWKVTKDRDYEFDAQLIVSDFQFFDLTYDLEEHSLIIEEFYQSKLCAETSYVSNPLLYNSKTIFEGYIKNKSELKVLMKQLNIIK